MSKVEAVALFFNSHDLRMLCFGARTVLVFAERRARGGRRLVPLEDAAEGAVCFGEDGAQERTE